MMKRPMAYEPFIEANLGPVLPSRPYVVRNSYSAPKLLEIPAVKHRHLAHAIQDLRDCRERMVVDMIARHRAQRAYLHALHGWELGTLQHRPLKMEIN